MNQIRIEGWIISVPKSFVLAEDVGIHHFEGDNGRLEVFFKSIKNNLNKSPESMVSYVQQIHEDSFRALSKYEWQCFIENQNEDYFYKSVLELYDPNKNYFVTSIVCSDLNQALQVTIHDYLCMNLEETRALCNKIGTSIQKN